MSDKKVEMTKAELEKRIKDLESEMARVVGIANSYIGAFRDLLFSLKGTVETNNKIDALLQERSAKK